MHTQKRSTPRADYRREEAQRAEASHTLSQEFPSLKALTVAFAYFDPDGLSQNSEIKYTVNPAHAKSVFRLDCRNPTCVRGDFDLSAELARAVAARRTTVTGEMRCEGWLNKDVMEKTRCHNILRFKMSLKYASA